MAEQAEHMNESEDFIHPPRPTDPDTPKQSDFPDREGPSSSSAQATTSTKTTNPPKNAFTALMSAKSAHDQPPRRSLAAKATQTIRGVWRGALADYTNHPERFPRVVLRVTDHTVLIKDAFPKATVHLLLLPRSPQHHLLHPHAALADEGFLRVVGGEGARGEGRDWRREIRVGVHAHPSMAHLHVHVISRDMCSERVRHRNHYNSFTTGFFVPLEDYPLQPGDARLEAGVQNANLRRELVCWRCGQGFGKKFAELKRHLEGEFDEWKTE
ncbi:HIT-like protein [Trichocladium antarcticum]|uniref:HIT-like protein n=1 Tax=Trichocladium antarcticum TaxID=1450529 RepID=A0AAN6UKW7_9PEZI|nr:HIT-like protein [Trichocladium antarcticum]